MKRTIILSILLSVLLYGCNQPKYSNYYSFDNQIWFQDSSIVFDFNSDNSTKLNFEINLSYDNNYPFQNLYTTYSLIDSEKNVINSDMIELQLLKNEDYKLLIKHSMRSESLKGIKKLGLTITD